LPVTGGPLDPLLAQGVAERLTVGLTKARRLVAELNGSIGRDLADLAMKQAANFSVPISQYASSGVRPANVECGRRAL